MTVSPENPVRASQTGWFDSWFGKKKPKEPEPKNLTRELFETVVFVLVLVLMLQRFVAEAFVIPTGSMAETLYGNHVSVTCRECGQVSPLNSSSRNGSPEPITSYTCSNCGFHFSAKLDQDRGFANPDDAADFSGVWSGDRVLVLKPAYHIEPPKRFDVPVFKWPVEPFETKDRIPTNYIKRLVGLSGETIAVFDGDLYACKDVQYNEKPPFEDENDRWRYENMYPSHLEAIKAWDENRFTIIRKSPEEILAQRIIVFTMNHLPKSLKGIAKTRWHAESESGKDWEPLDSGFKHEGSELSWIRYRHLQKEWTKQPDLEPTYITDYLGYNQTSGRGGDAKVTDLILECTAEFQKGDEKLILQLNKGRNSYRAIFEGGSCSLFSIDSEIKPEKDILLAKVSTSIQGAGKHDIRLANVDHRLTVWVDGKVLPFGKDADFAPGHTNVPHTNDQLQPARIGATGQVTCSNIQLWRDIFYVCANASTGQGESEIQRKYYPSSDKYKPCSNVQTFYVQPGHYLCFGDNSNSSLDGRMWGLVPERLLLGKAVVVYWPPSRFGVIK